MSADRPAAELARERLEAALAGLKLKIKSSHRVDLLLAGAAHTFSAGENEAQFAAATQFRHLGLMFRGDGQVALSRDKLRKVQNLFRFAFRRGRRRWKGRSRRSQRRRAGLLSQARG